MSFPGSDGRSDVQHIQLGIVARNHPGAYMPSLGVGYSAPRLVSRFTRLGNRPCSPEFLAGNRVVSSDDAAIGTEIEFASARGKNLAIGDERAGRLPVIDNPGSPCEPPGHRIQREKKVVLASVDDLVGEDGEIPVDAGHRDELAEIVRHLAFVLPFQIAGGGVDRLNVVARIGKVHHGVLDQWRASWTPGPMPRLQTIFRFATLVRLICCNGLKPQLFSVRGGQAWMESSWLSLHNTFGWAAFVPSYTLYLRLQGGL